MTKKTQSQNASQKPRRVAARDTTKSASTPLARPLHKTPKRRVTPADALQLATRKWMGGERLDIGRLAQELGIGRATLFRWVGTREQLYGEVITRLYARQRRRLLETATGTGLDLLEDVSRRNLELLATAPALRTFIEHDPEFAIRLLTSPNGAPHRHCIQLEVELLRRVIAEAGIKPQLDPHSLANIIVRIGESFLYAGTFGGTRLDVENVVTAIRILVSAQEPAPATHERRKQPARPQSEASGKPKSGRGPRPSTQR